MITPAARAKVQTSVLLREASRSVWRVARISSIIGRKLRTAGDIAVALVALAPVVAGCSGVRSAAESDAREGRVPGPWSVDEVAAHLRFLNGREADGRATGSVGYGYAAAYAEARMREYGLQPVAPGVHRHLYFTPLNSVADARIVRFGPDTLALGIDDGVAPDPRSAAGSVRAGSLDLVGPGAPVRPDPAPVIVVAPTDTGSARLRAFEERGVGAVIMALPPSPDRVSRPLGRLVIVRTDAGRIERITGRPAGQPVPQEGVRVEVDVQVDVAGSVEVSAAAVNVLGYVPGRDPHLASELVLVAAAMDGRGTVAGSSMPDTSEYAVGAAAILEAARVLAGLAGSGQGPDRTVLFALFAGSRQDDSGARAWLANPTWPADATREVVLVGASDPGPFSGRSYPVRAIGSDAVAPGPGSLVDRASAQAAALSREVLLAASGMIWHRDGASRVPDPGP
jgi:hypothetical protein